jgi:hypothetical protein
MKSQNIEELVEYKDRNVVIILFILGLRLVDTRRDGGTVYFIFRSEDALPYIEMIRSNQPIPVDDIRKFITATALFNFLTKETV